MSSNAEEPTGRGKAIKIGLAVTLLAAAGLIAYTQRSTEIEQPNDPENATLYVCIECGHGFRLTAAEYVKLGEAGEFREGTGALGRTSLLKCPSCQKFGGIKGVQCPNDGACFPRVTKEGKPSRCPKCNWSPTGR